MKTLIPFAFGGITIGKDAEGRVSLTDLWKAAGNPKKKRPVDWLGRDSTQELIEVAASLIVPKMGPLELVASHSGRYGGTYAQQQIALSYAKWLSPELHLFVNQVFFERVAEEKNPDLITERAVSTYKKQGKDEAWIRKRMLGMATRSLLTGTLSKHGVTGEGYKHCTNAIYTPLFGGGAETVRQKKNLPAKANTREHMSAEELTAVELAEQLAAGNIAKRNIRGNANCESECLRTARIMADAIRLAKA